MTGGSRRAELALADTSVFIALEQDRPLAGPPPEAVVVSVITVGEIRLGVLAAGEGATRARRLETLSRAEAFEPRRDGDRHGLPIVSQDDDYDGVPGLEVVRV